MFVLPLSTQNDKWELDCVRFFEVMCRKTARLSRLLGLGGRKPEDFFFEETGDGYLNFSLSLFFTLKSAWCYVFVNECTANLVFDVL